MYCKQPCLMIWLLGTVVKQADAVLLGYPLLQDMPSDVRRNDLTFYEEVCYRFTQCVPWATHCVILALCRALQFNQI